MGTATITAEPDLDPRVEKLHDHLTRYKELHQVRASKRPKPSTFLSDGRGAGHEIQSFDSYSKETRRLLLGNEPEIDRFTG